MFGPDPLYGTPCVSLRNQQEYHGATLSDAMPAEWLSSIAGHPTGWVPAGSQSV